MLIIGSWALGFFGALLAPRGVFAAGATADDSSDSALALILIPIGLVIEVGGFIWAARTGRFVTRWRSIAAPLTTRQKRSAQRQIRGKERLDPAREPFLLALAAQNRLTIEGITPIYGGFTVLVLGAIVLQASLLSVVLDVVALALFAVAAVQLTVIYRASGRFLAVREATD